MLRIFKNRPFDRFARHEGITDGDLCDAVDRAERGLIDADLGGGVIKQRIARPGAGRSGGFRTIILYRESERAFFVHGFAKNRQANISKNDLQIFKRAAVVTLAFDDDEIQKLVESGALTEVICSEENVQE